MNSEINSFCVKNSSLFKDLVSNDTKNNQNSKTRDKLNKNRVKFIINSQSSIQEQEDSRILKAIELKDQKRKNVIENFRKIDKDEMKN